MSESSPAPESGQNVGRYVLFDEIASGGMATVHLARQRGAVGFARTVAVKRLHPQLAKDPEFTSMFLDEARLASRVRHPSVVSTLDVVATKSELLLVMEYVHGESLARLLRNLRARREAIPPAIASAILSDVLAGLGAAHEATDEHGTPLTIVHRDVSPQNVLVGVDGVGRLVDFGVAKAIGRLTQTQDGQVKGKTSYMSPEQLRGKAIDHRTDLYAAGVVFWEALVGERLFLADTAQGTMTRVLEEDVRAPSSVRAEVPVALDAVVLRSIDRALEQRYASAKEMTNAIEAAQPRASAQAVAAWMAEIAKDELRERSAMLAKVEKALPAKHDASEPSLDEVEDRSSKRRPAASATSSAVREEDLSTSTLPAMTAHSSSHEKAKSSKTLLIAVVALVVVLLGSATAVTMFVMRKPTLGTTSAAGQSASASANASTSASASATPESLPATSAHPTTATSSSSTTTAPATTPPPKRPSHQPPHPPPLDRRARCNPPYTVDPSGVRVPKKECF